MVNEIRFTFVVQSEALESNDKIALHALGQLIDSLNEGVVVADLYRGGKHVSTSVMGCQHVMDAHKKGLPMPMDVEFKQLHERVA